MKMSVKEGDFTGLAGDYSLHRPDYSQSVLSSLLGLLQKPVSEIDFLDVGAGTGIWTRMVVGAGVRSATAIEPNADMRGKGVLDSTECGIVWKEGSAEQTGVSSESVDWVTMASSFHWANFEAATEEFHRVLRPGGRFTALWNPRLLEVNPLLVEIENHLNELRPDIKRVSSGRSGITNTLTERLWDSDYFEDITYMEGRHTIRMSQKRYLGAWRSVNDLQVQLGPDLFNDFLSFVTSKIEALPVVEATYLTRAWSGRRKDR